MSPTVSAVITAYNASDFIEQSVRSILAQTHAAHECVVVDDGSDDDTVAVVRSINDPRVKLIEAGRVGRGRALNIGWRAATGAFIAVQDADDVSHPRRFEVLLALMAQDPSRQVIGSGQDMIGIDEKIDAASLCDEDKSGGVVEDRYPKVAFINPVSHTSVILPKRLLEEVGGYDESRKNLFDWDLMIRLAERGHHPYKYSIPLVFKRMHAGQFFEKKKRLRYVSSCFLLQGQAIKKLNKNPLFIVVFAGMFLYRLLPRSLRFFVLRSYRT